MKYCHAQFKKIVTIFYIRTKIFSKHSKTEVLDNDKYLSVSKFC